MSQSQCGCSASQLSYASLTWWAITLTNYLMRRSPSLSRCPKASLNISTSVNTSYPVLAPVSQSYPRGKGWLSTCYSPVRH